jgi:hypothetical protein
VKDKKEKKMSKIKNIKWQFEANDDEYIYVLNFLIHRSKDIDEVLEQHNGCLQWLLYGNSKIRKMFLVVINYEATIELEEN